MKTLKLTPGIKSVGEGSGECMSGEVITQNLILLDEATVYNADRRPASFYNSDAIKDIQMFKGTAPSEYGGRISSVLDENEWWNNQKYHVGGGIGLISSRLNIEGPIVEDKVRFLSPADVLMPIYFLSFRRMNSSTTINSISTTWMQNWIIKSTTKNRLFLSGYFGRDVSNFRTDLELTGETAQEQFAGTTSGTKGCSATLQLFIPISTTTSTSCRMQASALTSIIKTGTWSMNFSFSATIKHCFVRSQLYLPNHYSRTTWAIGGQWHTANLSCKETCQRQCHLRQPCMETIGTIWILTMVYVCRLLPFGSRRFYTYKNGEVNSTTTTYGKGELFSIILISNPSISPGFLTTKVR